MYIYIYINIICIYIYIGLKLCVVRVLGLGLGDYGLGHVRGSSLVSGFGGLGFRVLGLTV